MNTSEIIKGLDNISCVDCKYYNSNFAVCDDNRRCDEYIIEASIKLGKYRWHDLRIDPSDVPFNGEEVLAYTNDNDYRVLTMGYSTFPMIVKWKYIDPE